MDFHLDDDQQALQDQVSRFCRARWPLDRIAEREPGVERGAWRELVELGAISVMAEESRGGLGLGAVAGAVVFEQLGRHLAPGPCLDSALAATALGEVVMAGVVEDADSKPLFVEHAFEIDALLALRRDGVWRIDRGELPPAVEADALDPLARVGVLASLPRGARIGDAGDAARLRRLGVALAASLQLGIADAAVEVAVAYALERRQFGVPIGSFQALKHIMADMYVRVGLARSATYAAAAVLDDPLVGDADRSLAAAKLLAGEAAVENARAAIQVLGGMGFTWAMPPHFLLKRALVLDHRFGTPTAHALALGSLLEKEVA
jgi:alkylation response protein AidB-like acyl-CoA dehydrogenase